MPGARSGRGTTSAALSLRLPAAVLVAPEGVNVASIAVLAPRTHGGAGAGTPPLRPPVTSSLSAEPRMRGQVSSRPPLSRRAATSSCDRRVPPRLPVRGASKTESGCVSARRSRRATDRGCRAHVPRCHRRRCDPLPRTRVARRTAARARSTRMSRAGGRQGVHALASARKRPPMRRPVMVGST
jgi:hypothetical protein